MCSRRYLEVVEALGGSSASICADDLNEPIREILIAAAGAASRSRLEYSPISGSIEVAVSDRLVPRERASGFDYEPGANSVLFFGDATLPAGAAYSVRYLRYLGFGL